ncbi:beta strand repeat-containing protein [Tautonia rosea]|uniref:beta strand repeat-containing protein n=1 Tax=Tautonia rosea TaxID=2728037 RepID=UPI0014744248|nr:right-handed parallel beta-helix repeat-containing protein [Tautonia rosea]
MSRQGRRAVRALLRRRRVRGHRLVVEPMERRELLATIQVTTLTDALAPIPGQVSLRSAIEAINAGGTINPDILANTTGTFGDNDRIVFNGLSGSITLVGSLPDLSVPVVLDGTSGAGFSDRPVLTIDGDRVANRTIRITGPNVTIQSLAIVGSRGAGVEITGLAATGAILQGNHIGVDAAGTTSDPNLGGGVVVTNGASNARIGGALAAPFVLGTVGNVIAGNDTDNVLLNEVQNVLVQGNFIGTDRTGTVALRDGIMGVDGHGVQIVAGSGHTVGGLTANLGNLISGNGINGVEVRSGNANRIAANRIGTAVDGVSPLRNEFLGIRLHQASTNNTIGGANATPFVLSAGNLVAHNGGDGIRIQGPGTTGNLVAGNFVGVDVTGTIARENLDTGIEINNATLNTIGGTGVGMGNLISGNRGDGILLANAGAANNLIQGNRIGTNASGTSALPNQEDGIEINGGLNNTIGGAAAGAGNLISGNGSDGIELERTSSGNVVQGNLIGTNFDGSAAVPNVENGVRLDAGLVNVGGTPQFLGAVNNTIGGVNASSGVRTAGNLISGNGHNGILLYGGPTSNNAILGNFIGTNANGSSAIGNTRHGILLEGASNNTIGGENISINPGTLRAGNLVSGNGGDGIRLTTLLNEPGGNNAASASNLISGNFVGTNPSGSLPIGNAGAGIALIGVANPVGGVSGNTIGGVNGAPAGLRRGNLISGNIGPGLLLQGEAASGNIALGNFVGTNVTGLSAIGNAVGILLSDAPSNTLGEGNVISGNLSHGVHLTGTGSTSNALTGNFIGLGPVGATAVPNGGDGVRIEGASANSLTRNVVSSNLGTGIALIGPGATNNVIRSGRIGTDDVGLAARGNLGGGILLINASGNTIGGVLPADGNIISGNAGSGIVLQGSGTSNTQINGNVIGLDATGEAPLGNAAHGVAILNGASANRVGGDVAGSGNLISGNGGDGVVLAAGAFENLVSGNVIGANVVGTVARGNGGTGVRISDSARNTIGGRSNLISGNGVFGLTIAGGSASGNVVSGNLIGTNLAGTASLGTQQIGLVILNAPNNRVENGNLIAGHSGDGLQVIGSSASGNLIDGNLIGTDETGLDGLGNARGVFLDIAPNNVLAGNVISGNRNDGVMVLNGANGNLLTGNLIGLAGPTGSLARPNLSGVLIVNANNTSLDSNAISGNRGFGVALASTSGNFLTNNLIGTNRQGIAARPNTLHGVMVLNARNNTLSANVLSGNRLFGVELRDGSDGNTLIDNLIGTDRTGQFAIANQRDGVFLDNAASNRLERNVISGNLGNGVMAISQASNTVLIGNFIGTNRDGSAILSNRGSGVIAAGPSNMTLQSNVVSGNIGFGIALVGGTGNVIADSFVGTNALGEAALSNRLVGVLLLNAPGNTVLNSVIAANGVVDRRGNLRIDGPGSTGNRVLGSFIGTDRTGSRSLDPQAGNVQTGLPTTPNDGTPGASDRRTFDPRNDGIVIADGASNNTIGGIDTGQGNVISGNRIGVYIRGQSARNLLQGNRIGTNRDGSAAVANSDGVIVMNSSNNTIGGTGPSVRNLISGNLEVGVRLTSIAFDEPRAPASGNLVAGNFIGTDATGNAALANRQGIFIYGAAGNQIGLGSFTDPNGGGNLLSGNREVGLQILNADTINAVTVLTPAGPQIVPYPPAVGAVTTGNIVAGNRVGTNAAGTARLPNFQGIFVSDAPGNTIADNLISGNSQVGLNITAFNAINNLVTGNRIGPDINNTIGTVGNGFADPNGLGSGLFLNQVVDGANTIASTNDIRGNVTAQTRTRTIAAGPYVERVIPVFNPTTGALIRIDVRINGYLSRDASRTLNLANFSLVPNTTGAAPIPIASVSYDEVARMLSITPSSPIAPGQSVLLTLVGRAPGGLQSRPGPGISPAFLAGSGFAGTNFTQVLTIPAPGTSLAARRAGGPSALGVDLLLAGSGR